MSKNKIVLIIGIVLFLIPFLGFPTKWKHFFFIISGVSLIALSFSQSIKRRNPVIKKSPRRKKEKSSTSSAFVDGPVSFDSANTEVAFVPTAIEQEDSQKDNFEDTELSA